MKSIPTLVLTSALVLTPVFLNAQLLNAGAVYTISNAAAANQLLVFHRAPGGALQYFASVTAGGAGTGAGLGSDNSVQISEDGQWLVTVNAGSNTIAAFSLAGLKPQLTSVVSSGGTTPISVAFAGSIVYVLNNGSPAGVAGFTLSDFGLLSPIAGSTQPLSNAAPVAPQIGFSPDGYVVVTEKATNSIDVFTAQPDGTLSPAKVQASSGQTPFGFLFDRRGHLIVTEAFGAATGASAVSSYDIQGGSLQTISGSVPNHQTASCWIAISRNHRYIYAANTDSDDLSSYTLSPNGALALIGSGVAGTVAAGSKPADLAFSGNGRYLYVLNGGLGDISGWSVQPDGTLISIGTFGNVPLSGAGLASN